MLLMAKAKTSKTKKPAKKKTKKKAAKRASASSRRAPAKKSKKAKKAKKVKKTAPRKAAASRKAAAPRKVKKAAPKKKQKLVGEGDYAASRTFLKDQSDFVKKNKAKIPAMGKEAEAALDGPEGDSLRAAEKEAMSRSTID
jgi:hypothetical protein